MSDLREYPTQGVHIPAFRGDRFFLSNMFPCLVVYEGLRYTSAEHAFQAQKCLNPADANLIRMAVDGYMAKKIGRAIQQVRPDWDNVRINIMFEVLRAKFSYRDMAELLLSTGTEELVEYNTWRDRFWGVWQGRGENHLGRLLMELRQELRQRRSPWSRTVLGGGGGWVAWDLDGTLAYYDEWRGPEHIGEPIERAIRLLKLQLFDGEDVRIFTARIADPEQAKLAVPAIEAWCERHIGRVLPITNVKDFGMKRLYDDRCVQVEQNTGRLIGEAHE